MMWFDVDAALAEVPVNAMPLIDDTDFKSIEASVAFNATGLALKWNFVTTAGAFSQTAVTPTESAGDYDWGNQGGGLYTIEMPASGGASINNDTEGFGWFSGVADGVLPWAGPRCGFRAANLNDALIDLAAEVAGGFILRQISDGTGMSEAGVNAAMAGVTSNLSESIVAGSLADVIVQAILARLGTPAGDSVSDDIAAVKSDTGATKNKTDSLTFSVAGKADSNITHVNDAALTGTGSDGDPWGPA